MVHLFFVLVEEVQVALKREHSERVREVPYSIFLRTELRANFLEIFLPKITHIYSYSSRVLYSGGFPLVGAEILVILYLAGVGHGVHGMGASGSFNRGSAGTWERISGTGETVRF